MTNYANAQVKLSQSQERFADLLKSMEDLIENRTPSPRVHCPSLLAEHSTPNNNQGQDKHRRKSFAELAAEHK